MHLVNLAIRHFLDVPRLERFVASAEWKRMPECAQAGKHVQARVGPGLRVSGLSPDFAEG